MSEHAPLVRQWILLQLLSSRRFGISVREMAEELNVTQKTIRRDLETFLQAGFPLAETQQDHGRKVWHLTALHGQPAQPGLNFAFDEALALYLGRRFLEPLAGTPFWTASQSALRKIRAVLGEQALKYVESFAEFFHQTQVGAGDYSQKSDLIDALMVGIEDSQAVFITYQSLKSTEPATYDVYPYGLVYHRGSLYLVGQSVDDGKVRHWKLDRMTDAKATGFPSKRPADFDLAEHLRGAFGVFHGEGDEEITVRVRFAPRVARYVQESSWHASQRLKPQKDGSVLAEFLLGTTEEIKRWLLSFGRHAEVLEPEELRSEIKEELQVLLAAYESDSHPSRRVAAHSR